MSRDQKRMYDKIANIPAQVHFDGFFTQKQAVALKETAREAAQQWVDGKLTYEQAVHKAVGGYN